ncbi:hypothetical protein QFC22_001542 [Naganishia vaughanmartiniae]|uniref:Uncharacterized protein n=1 Tax=Naganishia vaughanmartiniae TaxID=1424756 RepID=A0ACC2XHN5_9TREE|nr:hypothetical protein QFC22_001542 [Naganishia vaughanmartiniae]
MPSITAAYRISPPEGTPSVNIPTENEHVVELKIGTAPATSEDGVKVTNGNDSPYYTVLLEALAEAKEKLNEDMTVWKEAVGDREKQKEVISAGTKGQQGNGKAMMMVKAARENDALPDDDDEEDEEEDDDDDDDIETI